MKPINERRFYLGKQLYTGEAAFIKGYNGFVHSEDDGLFCALLTDTDHPSQLSCWKNLVPNKLLDEDNEPFVDWHRGGEHAFLIEGQIYWKYGYVLLYKGLAIFNKKTKKTLEFYDITPIVTGNKITDFEYILIDSNKNFKKMRQGTLEQKLQKAWEITSI